MTMTTDDGGVKADTYGGNTILSTPHDPEAMTPSQDFGAPDLALTSFVAPDLDGGGLRRDEPVPKSVPPHALRA
jgi:hypothetical protein